LSTPSTIKEALSQASSTLIDSDSSVLDCEVLLAHTLKKSRSYFRAWPDKTLSADELRVFKQLVKQRQQGQPIAYLTGEREFWSRSFIVSPSVLIPRPDTEVLIDIAQQKFSAEQSFSVLDLGTGSGIIAITLALEFKHAVITAIDASSDALSIAKKNAQLLGASNIDFILSDWFEQLADKKFDLIVSNPPYICPTDPHLSDGDVRFEPSSALVSEQEGLEDIEQIISGAQHFLKPNGIILFEHGFQQGKQVENLLRSSGFKPTENFRDIQGHIRATLGRLHKQQG